MKVLCNLTWRCTLGDCRYCWIYGENGVGEGFVKQQGEEEELFPVDWIVGLNRLPPFSIIDFCGGEPTILGKDLIDIICSLPAWKYRWGLTTNLATEEGVKVLEGLAEGEGLGGCVSLNCSYHHGVPLEDWLPRFRRAQLAFGHITRINIIDSPYYDYSYARGVLEAEVRDSPAEINYEPYQNPRDADLQTGERWRCSAGFTHVVIAPDGTVYSCLCGFRSSRRGEFVIGNLIGEVKYCPPFEICSLNCDPIEAQCWGIHRVKVKEEGKR